jgi:two-component system, sensor histidine kinase
MSSTPPVVLVLENDELNRELLVDLLGLWSYTVHSFASPALALAAIRETGLLPDLVMTDFHLDDKLNGVEFVRQLRATNQLRSLPAIVVTGDSSLSLSREGLTLASVALKPIRPEKLRTQLDQVLRANRPL